MVAEAGLESTTRNILCVKKCVFSQQFVSRKEKLAQLVYSTNEDILEYDKSAGDIFIFYLYHRSR